MTNAHARSKSLIAVFIDGTMNEATPSENDGRTNVRRLFEELGSHPDAVRLYLPGVGCEAVAEMDSDSAGEHGIVNAVEILLRTGMLRANSFFEGLLGKFFGAGLTARVLAAYAFICATRRQYPDARLCIVGFSRGAYACCVLAHFMERAGVVVAKEELGLHLNTIRSAWTYDDKRLAAMIRSGESAAWQLPANAEEIRVDFLGCWDTVCAMGAPEHGLNLDVDLRLLSRGLDFLYGRIHRQVKILNPRFVQLFLPPNVVKARHALALHEYRVSFEVLLWTPPDARDQEPPPDIVQMWFPGAHGDVGGGYLETDASNVSSSHALRWMKHEMWPDRWFGTDSLTNVWPIHDSSSGIFKRMAPKIRWSLTRAKAAQLRTMEISEWLQLGLRQGPKVVLCDDRATTPPALCAFRPVIAALHANVHDLARLAWLRVGLARAASKHSDGSIPPAYANPSAIEALEALSASASGFMRELNAAGVAVLATDRVRSARMARLCCYHLALTGNPSALISAARDVIRQTQGGEATVTALRELRKVLLVPIAFVLGQNVQRSVRNQLQIQTFIDSIDAPAGEVVKL